MKRLIVGFLSSGLLTSPTWTETITFDDGKVGVWTKADSVTLFNDFSYGGK